MAGSFLTVLLFALLPAAVMSVGGVIALFATPGPALRSAILHFAGGVVFSVVAVELLPDIVAKHRPWEIAIGFGLGVATMLLVRHLTRNEEKRDAVGQSGVTAKTALPLGLLAGVAVDLAVDGILLGIGFSAGAKQGTLLAFALTVELLSLGLAISMTLIKVTAKRTIVAGIVSCLSLIFVVFAAGGATMLYRLPQSTLELVLSFGVAALMFLVTEELLVEAHEEPESPWLTATFFAGFLLFLLFGMLG